MSEQIIKFIRKKDFTYIRDLGQGACGKTVLLHDPVIDEHFVCKKFLPIYEPLKQELFRNFVREIKLLHILNHPNVVRVFNYYLYPDLYAGYILMELVQGVDIEEYLAGNPEQANQIFLQTVDGFAHLEKHEILHRDIRPQNILVSNDGVTKIIDFGFGKRITTGDDFDKSITLNWWCEPPLDFAAKTYDYSTEVYFVGKLFEKIILEAGIEQFSYKSLLTGMCSKEPEQRIKSFARIKHNVVAGQLYEMPFSEEELEAYRNFADDLSDAISKIERSTKYFDNAGDIERKLEAVYRTVMLERYVPNNTNVIRCFVNGAYYFSNNHSINVENLREFIRLLRSCPREKKDVIISNIFSRLDAIKRYQEKPQFDDDIPF